MIQSLNEYAALKWAIEFFRGLGDELTRVGSRQVAYDTETFVRMYDEWRPENPEEYEAYTARLFRVAETNEGDAAIFELCFIAAELIERGEPLPDHLKVFIVNVLRRDPIFDAAMKPGPKRTDLAHRDVCIAEAVEHIVKTWNFSATRNNATETPSATSIVKVALERGAGLHLTEAAINKIWKWSSE